jgi:hypothetical protein
MPLFKYFFHPFSPLLILLILVPNNSVIAQPSDAAVSYLFDNHNYNELHNRTKVRYRGTNLVEDRFGNEQSAVALNGHLNSYLNLGVSPLLQPKTGSISIWVNITSRIYAGKGAECNPILMIKNGPGDDFYTAYSIIYQGNQNRFIAYGTKDSTNEATVLGSNEVQFGKWYHLVMTFSDHELAFYVNGKLQGRSPKDYSTFYLQSDSLVVGHSANKKNERYTLGIFDDIRIYHRVLNDREILDLYQAPNPNKTQLLIEKILYGLAIVGGIILIALALVWRRNRRLRIATEKLEMNRRLHEMEIRTLKAQMNPHFIFNALNSIQVFILSAENEKAGAYLSKFSKLMRELLESNANESLSVREEVEILTKYLELESLRFGQSFSYEILVDETIDTGHTLIPHMMIQPFVENAIWHGLLNKDDDRRLLISMEYNSAKTIRCMIDDNGVGRKATQGKEHTMKSKSLALSIVKQRLHLMSSLLKIDCSVEIIDKLTESGQPAGTQVIVTLPIL